MPVPATITVRHPEFDLADLPVDWVGGGRMATHFGNAGHVFIPLGEQFFIDTVKAFRHAVPDAAFRRDLNAFLGQEAVHKRTHEQVWAILEQRGVPVQAYARFVEAVRSGERFVPPALRLSVTAALEHFTAAFGAAFLEEHLDDVVPAEMARLLAWHGLEELEHRAVAFDVLGAVDGGYALRLAGFTVATGMLVWVPLVGVVAFAAADATRRRPALPRSTSALVPMAARFGLRMARHVAAYLDPRFHPSHVEVPEVAARWAAELETADARRS